MAETEDWPSINLVVELRATKIDREISKNEVVEEVIHDGLEARRFRRMTFLQHEVFRGTSYQRNIISNTLEAGRELSRTGIKQDGNQARWDRSTTGKPKIGRNPNFEICRKDRNQTNGPRSTRWLGVSVQNVVSTVQKAECLQKLEVSPCMGAAHAALHVEARVMQPDIWEEWWRPTCVLAMLKDMWSTRCRRTCVRRHAKRHTGWNQPEADWLLLALAKLSPNLGFTMKKLTGLDRLIWTDAPLAPGQFFGLLGGVSGKTSTDLNPESQKALEKPVTSSDRVCGLGIRIEVVDSRIARLLSEGSSRQIQRSWTVVWTGQMVRNTTLLGKDFISIWGKRDREGFEESGQVRIMGNQSVMAEQQYEMIQRSFN
ncbi:hypothetical protein DY000_02008013 [Brassica cretica]|uniref:Uncharacterized protein n=1 Tax=Brassica cretica TaxID=69181 RepID=A0ABQ7CGP3_BRACR|nr:hypothetical protein DY000_02008013 [Brassica cretica]